MVSAKVSLNGGLELTKAPCAQRPFVRSGASRLSRTRGASVVYCSASNGANNGKKVVVVGGGYAVLEHLAAKVNMRMRVHFLGVASSLPRSKLDSIDLCNIHEIWLQFRRLWCRKAPRRAGIRCHSGRWVGESRRSLHWLAHTSGQSRRSRHERFLVPGKHRKRNCWSD